MIGTQIEALTLSVYAGGPSPAGGDRPGLAATFAAAGRAGPGHWSVVGPRRRSTIASSDSGATPASTAHARPPPN